MSTPETNSNEPNDSSNPRPSHSEAEAGGTTQDESQANSLASNSGQQITTADGASSQEDRSETQQTASSTSTSIATNPIDNPQSLPPVVVGVEEKPDVKEPSLPIIGFNLSSFLLIIISGFILFLAIYLSTNQFEASSLIQIPKEANISDSTYARKIELIRMIQEEKKSYREFTVQMSQMVLLNLLLPVLTAILGYIFASSKNTNNT